MKLCDLKFLRRAPEKGLWVLTYAVVPAKGKYRSNCGPPEPPPWNKSFYLGLNRDIRPLVLAPPPPT